MNHSASRGIDLVARTVSIIAFSLPFYEVYEAMIEPPLRRLSLLSLSMRLRVVARKCYECGFLSLAVFLILLLRPAEGMTLRRSKSAIGSLRRENIV
jgi:hypothetical protein